MKLETKPDFDQSLRRFEAWWDGQIVDRPPLTVGVWRLSKPKQPRKKHASLRDRWMDVDYQIDCVEASLAGAQYLADSFPCYFPNLGPEVCGTLFGCELEFAEETSWSKPVLASCREVIGKKPDLQNEYWRTLRKGIDASLRRGQGRWITGITDFHTNADLLAALRDPQELCIECADDIEAVAEACDYVTDFFGEIFDDIWQPIASAGQPCTTWTPSLHVGRGTVLQCDFICMISPAMFAKIIRPALQREVDYFEKSIYHLDGPGALRHLDAVLEMDGLNAVQWVYGAGQGSARDWIEVYRKIQAAGKAMEILCANFEDAVEVAGHIKPPGAWFHVYKRYPPAEVEAFCKRLEAWSAGKAI